MEKGLDIYFDDNYAKLYEKIENGVAENFVYHDENGIIKTNFIKRRIPIKLGEKPFYDIVSPYGYGGPIILDSKDDKALVDGFEQAFSRYCKENNIVSEFVRFHPIVGNGKDFQDMYQAQLVRNTVGTNLKNYEEPVQVEFSKSCRKRIRRALRDGVTYRIIEKPESLQNFKNIYYSTMDRNEAGEYYYFSDEYFEQCLRYFRENIILVEAIYEKKVIAAGFYFIWDKIIHIHLSGTLSEYLYLSPAYVLRYAVTLWGKENGYELIHHGGGRSNAEDDSLYTFKKQFGEKTSFDFYVGKKIWDEAICKELCDARGVEMSKEGFFPKYREER